VLYFKTATKPIACCDSYASERESAVNVGRELEVTSFEAAVSTAGLCLEPFGEGDLALALGGSGVLDDCFEAPT
jgi:hypothetical protein